LGGPIPETIDKDLLANGISEKDLEIEHLVTQVVALTEKADVIEDMRKDVAANKQMLNDSEQKREGLQVDLADASEKIKKASTEGVSQV
jgi:septal ring factor EnvC (AmiA/AmiB activator)